MRASPSAILHPSEGALELVHDSGARQRLPRAASTTVQWVLNTTLVLLDGHDLLDLESGRRRTVYGVRGSSMAFALAAKRIYVVEEGELVILDLHLRELAREVPTLTLYTGDNRTVWKQGARDDLGFLPAMSPWAVALRGFRSIATVPVTWAFPTPVAASAELPGPVATIEGSPLLIGDTWLTSLGSTKVVSRPPGPVMLPVGVREGYALIAGRPYQLKYDYLAHVPRNLGQIAHADAHVVVITGEDARVIWVSRDGGPLRGYSLEGCIFR